MVAALAVVKLGGRQEVCIVLQIIDGPSDTGINATQAALLKHRLVITAESPDITLLIVKQTTPYH